MKKFVEVGWVGEKRYTIGSAKLSEKSGYLQVSFLQEILQSKSSVQKMSHGDEINYTLHWVICRCHQFLLLHLIHSQICCICLSGVA